ncbi:hypothetical protein [Pedobacter sp. Leaf41]|uniref:hypothetical protein n=1 Tax=Pedobacter sp. Leaf41 TaxID=1736218 RepID=UPI000AF0545E|nr:hypothetical protein [Pedobacter sp. Leaf41]
MKRLISILLMLFFCSIVFGQQNQNESQIKITIIDFLRWYKENESKLMTSPIVNGYNEDTIKKDSVLRVDMKSVDEYLSNFKKSNYVSDSFLGNLRALYKSISDTLIKHPIVDYFGPVPGLECDLLFGFEPEEILGHIEEGHLSEIYLIYNKALVKFDISKFNQMIFSLTKIDNKRWVIDSLDYDGTNADRAINKKSHTSP